MLRADATAILEALPEPAFVIGTDKRLLALNGAAAALTGVSPAAARGRPCADVVRCGACGSPCPLDVALRTGAPVTRDGVALSAVRGPRTVTLHTAPLRATGGQVIGVLERVGPGIAAVDATPRARPPSPGRAADALLVGTTPRMRLVMDLVDVLKDSDATVLLHGESGTGKGVVASLIHRLGRRARKPFVKVNCGALPDSLLESELFGHVKGAFTGAVRDSVGRFELADGGTVFLDEVGELSPATQVKLLRVLQEQEFERVGSTRTVRVDVRVIAATNSDLAQLMAAGRFRADLYYRLNVIPIELPPLRERRDDIPAFVEHILARLARREGAPKAVTPEVMAVLLGHDWPGNVRELENALEHAFVCSRGSVIEPAALPGSVVTGGEAPTVLPGRDAGALLAVIASAGGNRAAAARVLGVNRTTVWRRLKRLGVAAAGPR